jgi:hypothetical protein
VLKQSEPADRNVVNPEGYINGRAQNETGLWSYAVFLYEADRNWSFDEGMLETTGKFDESRLTNTMLCIRMEGNHGIVVPREEE